MMSCRKMCALLLFCILVIPILSSAQQTSPGAGIAVAPTADPISNRTISFSGAAGDQPDGPLSVTFSLYAEPQGGTALWTDTQTVQLSGGHFSALLGSNDSTGVPPEFFAADQAHWLGVRINGNEQRYLLVSVPYALKAVEAERLGGRLASDYVTVQQLQSLLQNSSLASLSSLSSSSALSSASQTTLPTPASSSTTLPATNFTDNNASEVLLVTQLGTGFAIHAISSGSMSLFAEDSNSSGTAIKGSATSTTGHTVGVFGSVSSPDGIAGIFDNISTTGRILSLRSNAIEVASFDQNGLTASKVTAGTFTGSGSGLTNIPLSALPAFSDSFPATLVSRDNNGDFAAHRITANTFVGSGAGLTNIPLAAVPSTSVSVPLTLVSRDNNGDFSAHQITANTFSGAFNGNGSGLTNIPISALPASSSSLPLFLVARDSNGDFAARQITANTFVGSGAGLTNIPLSALPGATSASGPLTIVARDSNGSFAANQVTANTFSGGVFSGSGSGLTNIPISALPGATSASAPLTIVTRDNNGDFAARQITAITFSGAFSGNGAGLTNIPISALPASSLSLPLFLVARDSNGDFAARQITANTFVGSGAGLTNIPLSALPGATPASGPFTIVARDSNSSFAANQITANTFVGKGTGLTNIPLAALPASPIPDPLSLVSRDNNGNFGGNQISATGLSTGNLNASGFADFTSASKTAPIRAVLSANMPTSCLASKELLIKTDAPAGQQLFICNSLGNGYVLVGDGAANGVLSFNGRSGAIAPAAGDYSFSQLNGSAVPAQLPSTTVYSNQGNVFSADQTVQGNLTAAAFTGDGSGLTNINAAKIGGLTAADLATNAALSTETTARQNADTTLQSNLNAETAARQLAETGLQNSVTAETAARQAADSALQAGIDGVNNGSAKLAASNTFTAGTQDFSGAAATLPVKALPSSQTPSSCVASKELLIKTDAPAGEQLFICDSSGGGWNLVGDGAAGGVSAFNGRTGSVTPSAGDYSFAQISGSVAASQMPEITGDVTASAGTTSTTLSPTGVVPGTYSKITVDAKGRATAGAQVAFADLAGSVTAAQLPPTVVFSDRANTFSASQTVNGSVTAASFSGNGAGLAGVNATSLNGLSSASFAQLGAENVFTVKQTLAASNSSGASLNIPMGSAPASPAAGDVWNTGTVLQYRDNAATTRSVVTTTQSGGLALLKITGSITPASVAVSSCSEQSFPVTGIDVNDVILRVQQPATTSPGNNIAIGGWRVSAANTVAIQFCNVGRINRHTPAAGTYIFVLAR